MKNLIEIIIGAIKLYLLIYVGGFLLIGVLNVFYEIWELLAVFLGIFLVAYIIKVYCAIDEKRDFIVGLIILLWLIATPFVWYHYQYWYTPFVWLLLSIVLSIPLNWKELKPSGKKRFKKAKKGIEEEEKKQRELA